MKDASWIEAWRDFKESPGEDTFAPVYQAIGPRGWAVCRGLLGEGEDVADAFQGAWARILVQLDKLPPEGDQAWWMLLQIFRREAERIRKQRQRRTRREIMMDPGMDPAGPHGREELEQRLLRAKVEAILATFPDRLADPLSLHYLEGFNHREISEALGVSRTTVTSRISTGTKRLHRALQKAGITGGTAALALLKTPGGAIPDATHVYQLALAAGKTISIGVGTSTLIGVLVMQKKYLITSIAVAALILAGGSVYLLTTGSDRSTVDPAIPGLNDEDNRESGAITPTPEHLADIAIDETMEAVKDEDETDPATITMAMDGEEDEGPVVLIIRGRVLDQSGNPIRHADVFTWRQTRSSLYGGGGGRPSFSGSEHLVRTRSDLSGAYQIESRQSLPLGLSASSESTPLASHSLNISNSEYAWFRAGVPVIERDLVLPDGGAHEGRVVDSSGEPIAGALITPLGNFSSFYTYVPSDDVRETLTNDQGKFRIYPLPMGSQVNFNVTAEGYYPARFGGRVPRTDLIVEMKRGTSSVSGSVHHFTTLEAIPHARVQIAEVLPPNYFNDNPINFETRSDEKGLFRFDGLAAGNYAVAAEAEGMISLTPEGRTSIPVVLADEEEIEGLDVYLGEFFLVVGRVLDVIDQSPIPNAVVRSSRETEFIHGMKTSRQVYTDDEGRFQFPGHRGGIDTRGRLVVSLTPEKQGYVAEQGEDVLINVSGKKTEVELLLRPGITVSGVVYDPEGRPEANVVVQGVEDKFSDQREEVFTNSRGEYIFLSGVGEPVQASARKAGLPVSFSEVVTSPDGDVENLDIHLDPGGEVHVIAEDTEGNPIRGASIGLIIRTFYEGYSSASRFDPAEPTRDGRRHFDRLPTTGRPMNHLLRRQTISVFASAEGYRNLERQVDEILPGKVTEARLVLEKIKATNFLGGVVVDEKGEPVSGAVIQIRVTGGRGTRVQTDRQGRFRADELDEGPYSLQVNYLDRPPAYEGDVEANRDDHRIVLPPDYSTFNAVVLDGETLEPLGEYTVVAHNLYEYRDGAPSGPPDFSFKYQVVRDPLVPERFSVLRVHAGHVIYLDVDAPGYTSLRGVIMTVPEDEDHLEAIELEPIPTGD